MTGEDFYSDLPQSSRLIEPSVPFLNSMNIVYVMSRPTTQRTGRSMVNTIHTPPYSSSSVTHLTGNIWTLGTRIPLQ
jgi:hypothetical protein